MNPTTPLTPEPVDKTDPLRPLVQVTVVAPPRRLAAKAITAVAVALEAYACLALWRHWMVDGQGLSPGLFLLAHLLACAMAASTAERGQPLRTSFIQCALLPPAGVLGRLLDVWIASRPRQPLDMTLLGELLTAMRVDPEGAAADKAADREAQWANTLPDQAPDTLLMAPIASLLNDPGLDPALKFAAVRNLTHLKPEDAVPLLKEALRSDLPSVRYYAAKLLGNLEEAFSKRLRKAGEEKNIEEAAYVELEFCSSGLLDPGDARRHREEAIAALAECAHLQRPRPALALALLDLGRYAEALEAARHFIARDSADQAAYRIAMEATLRMGRYLEFRDLARALAKDQPDADLARELIERFPKPPMSV